jgi:hypothetical protein
MKANIVQVSVDMAGMGTLTVDGADISSLVSGFTLTAKAGRETKCTLTIVPSRVEFSGPAKLALQKLIAETQEPEGE